jgi:HAD superfamily hydrolase (TIGR01459 family)
VARRTTEIGIEPALYDGLHSSGEETWQSLKAFDDPVYAGLDRRAFLIVPERDREFLDGLALEVTADLAAAGFVLVTGLAHASETLADYEAVLAAGARLGRPMICANPDLEVVRDGVRELCAGALALRYEALGGRVHYVGKPYPSVYRRCFSLFGDIERSRILAVGDSLRTDIAGARNAGIDSLLITGGIHAEELADASGRHPDPLKLAAACARAGQQPTFATPAFVWQIPTGLHPL